METNQRDFSQARGNERFGNESAGGHYSASENESTGNGPGQKFEQDNDDFNRAEDDMDGERDISTGFTGSSTSSDLSRDSSGAFSTDDMADDDDDDDFHTRNASATNDSGRSQRTNIDDEDYLGVDWNMMSL